MLSMMDCYSSCGFNTCRTVKVQALKLAVGRRSGDGGGGGAGGRAAPRGGQARRCCRGSGCGRRGITTVCKGAWHGDRISSDQN